MVMPIKCRGNKYFAVVYEPCLRLLQITRKDTSNLLLSYLTAVHFCPLYLNMNPKKVRLLGSFVVSFLETFLFSGIIFGFSVFQKMLLDDGIFAHFCSRNSSYSNATSKPCAEQNNHMNLIFTISILIVPFSALIFGSALDHFGMKPIKLILTVFFTAGCLSLGFASAEREPLVYVGFFSIATASISILVTNLPQSAHFPKFAFLVTTLLSGACDVSAFMVSVLYDIILLGLSRPLVIGIYAALGASFILGSAFIQIPLDVRNKGEIESPSIPQEMTYGSMSCIEKNCEVDEVATTSTNIAASRSYWKTLGRQLLSTDLILTIFWFSANSLRFNFFIGSHNIYLEILGFSQDKISDYTRLMYYCFLSTLLFSSLPGLIMDIQRRCFARSHFPDSKTDRLITILPLFLTIVLNIVTNIMTYFRANIIAEYFMMSLFRPFIYAQIGAFILAVFEKDSFGTIYGVVNCVGGILQLVQYPMVTWMNETKDTVTVSAIFMGLAAATSIHPIVMLFKTLKSPSKTEPLASTSLHMKM